MSKMLKMSILLMVIVLGTLLLTATEVSATEVVNPEEGGLGEAISEPINITGEESLKKAFEGKSATVDGTTITLTGNVEFRNLNWVPGSEQKEYEVLEFSNEDYVLNLNNFSLTAYDLNINDKSLTIIGSEHQGSIYTYGTMNILNGAKLEIKNGVYNSIIMNYGTLNIKNGNFYKSIGNSFVCDWENGKLISYGIMNIENGYFYGVRQEGKATIKGGNFYNSEDESALTICPYGDNKELTTTITGGVFITNNPEIHSAITILKMDKNIAEDEIYKYIGEGYSVSYDEAKVYTEFASPMVSYVSRVTLHPQILDEIVKKIAPDGKNAILKTVKPKDAMEADFILTNVANKLLNDEKYYAYAWCPTGDLNKIKLVIEAEGGRAEYNINVKYDEPEKNVYVQSFIDKLKKFDDTPETAYQVADLGLINYYMTSSKSELWNQGAGGRALRYSDEMIELTDGGDIKFVLDMRAGEQGDELMYENAFGEMTVFYNDYAYGNKQQGVHLKRVIYIPQDTENTKEAYADAAEKRINEYLGEDNLVTVKYGGRLDELDEIMLDTSVQTDKTDGNYYNITVKGKIYRFYIMKGTEEQLKEPIYKGKDYDTNIEIKSADPNVPLDTSVKAVNIKNDIVKKALGTGNYEAYDISLYSDAKVASIEKLENGKFEVDIPVPGDLKDKNLAIYYIKDSGEKEEHTVTIKDGIATFETNHFSTYALTEKVAETEKDEIKEEVKGEKDDTPKTGSENIIAYVIVTTILAGCVVVELTRKD